MTGYGIRKTLAVTVGTMSLALSGAAFAQGGYGQQGQQGQQGGYQSPPPQQQQGAKDFSDNQLQAFAEAQQEVSAISQELRQDIQNTEDSTERMKLQQKANQEMIQVVRDAGLDPATYNAIGKAVQNNPQLEKKVESMR